MGWASRRWRYAGLTLLPLVLALLHASGWLPLSSVQRVDQRLYDLDRKIRPVGTAYRELVATWRDILPSESLCVSTNTSPTSKTERPDPTLR